ncbi:MAG: type II toxin-antitoxin system Phd/YefM family antitoxin [Acidobacteriota bacterium]
MRLPHSLEPGSPTSRQVPRQLVATSPTVLPVSELKGQLAAILERVRISGQEILVTRHGRPLVRILPPVDSPAITTGAFGALAHTLREEGDLLTPLDEGDWEALE